MGPEFAATHVAAVRGVARATAGRLLPNNEGVVRVAGGAPGLARGLAYASSLATTGTDGAFAVQAERINRDSRNVFPDPDTLSAWVHWQALSPPYRELSGGRRKEDSVRVVLRFVPATAPASAVVRDLEITPP